MSQNQVKKLTLLRSGARNLATKDLAFRNELLCQLAASLMDQAEIIIAANQVDIEAAKDELSSSMLSRLKLDLPKLKSLADGLISLIKLEDPLGVLKINRELDAGLVLETRTVPLGVIACVFESRPDVLPQLLGLCLKSGNALVFKAGSESRATIKALTTIFNKILEENLGENSPLLLAIDTREDFMSLLKFNELIDLVIPRGSNELVQFIMQSTSIPVLGHADGVCHIFVDAQADFENALDIIIDAKTQYPAACNAVEVVLLHEKIAKDFLDLLMPKLKEKNVQIYACPKTLELQSTCLPFTFNSWRIEFSDLTLAIKIVSCTQEAIQHINQNGSHHTDAIVSADKNAQEQFVSEVDSADVFVNCSTRFADGYRFGLGAEVGISTSKIHARGPVGLEGLCSVKHVLRGSGQLVADYVQGVSTFTHKQL